jgi:glycosyltransferase involved in cell wall biosynthesis
MGARPVVGSVGRLERRKGHDVLIAAALMLRTHATRPQLLLVGDGPERAALEQACRAGGIMDDVVFTGDVDDVRPALSAMDVFVLPSREEGMSNALMEAMASARPVVATRVGGNGEVLDGGRLGRLVPSDDPVALARAVGEVLDEPASAAMGATTAQAFVTTRWGAGAMVGELESFYEARLAVHRRAA